MFSFFTSFCEIKFLSRICMKYFSPFPFFFHVVYNFIHTMFICYSFFFLIFFYATSDAGSKHARSVKKMGNCPFPPVCIYATWFTRVMRYFIKYCKKKINNFFSKFCRFFDFEVFQAEIWFISIKSVFSVKNKFFMGSKLFCKYLRINFDLFLQTFFSKFNFLTNKHNCTLFSILKIFLIC